MANEYGAFAPLTGGSSYWRNTNVTLLEGELAWETPDGGGTDGAYLLRGDGHAANGTPRGDYTRLRVDVAGQLATAGGETNILKHFIETLFARDGELESLGTGAKDSLVSALNEVLSLTAAAHAALEAETGERLAAESCLDAKLDSESARALAAESDLSDRVLEEAARAAAEEGALNARADALETGMADAALSAEGRYAPLVNPHFADGAEADRYDPRRVITVPDIRRDARGEILNGNQPVPVKNWKELYDLTMETSGVFVRRADTEDGAFEILLLTDAEAGVEYYREVDRRTANPDDCAARGDLDDLAEFVMDGVGEYLREADGATGNLRLTDAEAGAKDIYREIDRRSFESESFLETILFVHDFEWAD